MKNPVFPTQSKLFQKADAIFPTRLRELREMKGISQTEFKEAIGLSRSSVSAYEQGVSLPDIEVLSKIADYYGVTFDYLLGKSNNMYKENTDIGDKIGLSDTSIGILSGYNTEDSPYTEVLNNLLSYSEFGFILLKIHELKSISKEISSKEDDAKISYDPTSGSYIYKDFEEANSPEISEFERIRKELYGKNSVIVHEDTYIETLKLNIYNLLMKLVNGIMGDKD